MTTFTVSTNSELKAAIEACEEAGGGTILLENSGADYNLDLYKAGSPDGTTTIKSADPDDPAVMTGVRLVQCQNLSFEDLSFNSDGVIRPSWVKDFMVEKGLNISVTDSSFVSTANGTLMESGGDVVRGEDMGFVRDTNGFTFEGNTVSHYFNGLALVESNNLNVSNNEFSYMQGDGIRGGGMQDAVFENNWFHDWYGSAKSINHDDMFQIWGTNMDQLSKDILIKGNFFDSGGGPATQTILIQNEHWESEADNYTNIVVTENVIYNGHTHGVSIFDTTDVTVTNNTLLYNPQSATPTGNVSTPPSIRVTNPEGAVVEGNIAAQTYVGGQEQTQNNIAVDFSAVSGPNFVGHHFVNAVNGGQIDLRDLELLPDSPWYGGGFGATVTQGDGPQPGVTAVLTQTAVEGEYGTFVLDASLSHDATGYLDPGETTYEWHFSDGTVVEGVSVQIMFEDFGLNSVELFVRNQDGAIDSIVRGVHVEDPVIRDIDFNDGANTAGATFKDADDSNFVAGLEGTGFLLDGDSEVRFNKKESDFYELDQFTIELAFQKLGNDDSGRVFDLHRSMSLSVQEDGTVTFGMKTPDGDFSVNSGATKIGDTDWHKVSVTYNAAHEKLALWLDGEKLDEIHATGETLPYENWGPMLGNFDFKGPSLTAVVDNFLFSQESLSDFEVQQGHIDELSLSAADLSEVYADDSITPVLDPQPDPQPEPDMPEVVEIDPTGGGGDPIVGTDAEPDHPPVPDTPPQPEPDPEPEAEDPADPQPESEGEAEPALDPVLETVSEPQTDHTPTQPPVPPVTEEPVADPAPHSEPPVLDLVIDELPDEQIIPIVTVPSPAGPDTVAPDAQPTEPVSEPVADVAPDPAVPETPEAPEAPVADEDGPDVAATEEEGFGPMSWVGDIFMNAFNMLARLLGLNGRDEGEPIETQAFVADTGAEGVDLFDILVSTGILDENLPTAAEEEAPDEEADALAA